MKIENNKAAAFNYTLKNDAGEVIDESQGNPLFYLHGHQNIIPGLEKELEGKTTGDKVNCVIQAEQAYGPRIDELVQEVPKTQFEEADSLQVGMQFQVDTPQGPMVFQITEVKADSVMIDGNHPLAGMTLHFDVEVTDVRDATEEEISHGHAHQKSSSCDPDGGCC